LQSDSGVITSPNYPNNYDHDIGCAWEIIAEDGAQIEVGSKDLNGKLTFCKIVVYFGVGPL
jgi:hypothetical protein